MCGYAAAAADFIQENVRERKKKQNAIKYKNKIFKIKKGTNSFFFKKNKNV